MYSFTLTRNCTASLPSSRRWSYVRARYIIGLISTLPFTATGRSLMACSPRTALCGRLMIGVPIMEPNTPPLLMVKDPPAMSSMVNLPSRACHNEMLGTDYFGAQFGERTFLPISAMAFSIPMMSFVSAFLTTGVTRPFSVATATLIST